MKLWTIQTLEAWKELQSSGVLHTRQNQIDSFHKDYLSSYKWMMEQMNVKIGAASSKGLFPIWAWYQWDGKKRAKPDLRAIRWHHPVGEHNVCIEFICKDEFVLLSDFVLWHHVLNSCFLPKSEDDDNAFEKRFANVKIPDAIGHKIIEQSWQRIFDIDWEDPWISFPRKKKSIQATLWEIRLDMVTDITHFIGSNRSYPTLN